MWSIATYYGGRRRAMSISTQRWSVLKESPAITAIQIYLNNLLKGGIFLNAAVDERTLKYVVYFSTYSCTAHLGQEFKLCPHKTIIGYQDIGREYGTNSHWDKGWTHMHFSWWICGIKRHYIQYIRPHILTNYGTSKDMFWTISLLSAGILILANSTILINLHVSA